MMLLYNSATTSNTIFYDTPALSSLGSDDYGTSGICEGKNFVFDTGFNQPTSSLMPIFFDLRIKFNGASTSTEYCVYLDKIFAMYEFALNTPLLSSVYFEWDFWNDLGAEGV